jgi:hypothetical protein
MPLKKLRVRASAGTANQFLMRMMRNGVVLGQPVRLFFSA